MYLLYSLFLTLACFALLPYFAYQAFVNKKYLSNFYERLGRLPEALGDRERPAIWLHAVSVGEALAARPLISALRTRFPEYRLIVSTTTATGQAVARSRIAEADGFCYFPFDWRFSVRRALDRIRPQVVVLMESELWPNFLRECERREIPVLVANGRISDRSFKRSQHFSFLMRRMYARVTRFAMQSATDAERAIALGAPAERVSVSGNIKYDLGEAAEAAELEEAARRLEETFALDRAPLIIAGSTSDGEEEILLAAFGELRKADGLEKTRLLIAPRHPERFDAVARLLDSAHLRYARRSAYAKQAEAAVSGLAEKNLTPHSSSFATLPQKAEARLADVILLDSMGELSALYRFASVVFIGGSLVPKGGHNILEPAFHSRPIVVGPHMENFCEIAEKFEQRGALIRLRGASDKELGVKLQQAWLNLLTNTKQAQKLGENARALVDDSRGATARTTAIIAAFLSRPGAVS
jgi:3-deoxy-D-manno-octulosonic-acid transferase